MLANKREAALLKVLGLLPQNLMSRAVGQLSFLPLPRPLMSLSLRSFAKLKVIDLEEMELPLSAYGSFAEFFTRGLKPGARIIDRRPGIAVSPADGHILNSGSLSEGQLLQAKGRSYAVEQLLGDEEEAQTFRGGKWVTIYLSPRDYHRVHHPIEGRILSARYIPGRLWPVNRLGVQGVDQLFCVNERLITYLESSLGPVAVVMVGATSVGYITLRYDDSLKGNRGLPAGRLELEPISVARGEELGVFNLGSTVILLFANPEISLEPLQEGAPILMGQAVARGLGAF